MIASLLDFFNNPFVMLAFGPFLMIISWLWGLIDGMTGQDEPKKRTKRSLKDAQSNAKLLETIYHRLHDFPQEMTPHVFTAKIRILVTDLRDQLGAEYKSERTGLPIGNKERGWYVRKAGRHELLLSDDVTLTAITLGPLNIWIEDGKLKHALTSDYITTNIPARSKKTQRK